MGQDNADIEKPLVDGAPLHCRVCRAALCLRKQVINLALGYTETMMCLDCIGKENDKTARQILEEVMVHVQRRDCFNKEWVRYKNKQYCPDLKGCFPDSCFAEGGE